MLQENEVVMFLLGAGLFFFILLNRAQIKRIYAWKILISSYCFLLSGWLLTILEGFFLESIFNFMEHLSYAISAVLLTVWCFKAVNNSWTEVQP
jgi:hypothetical protein